MIERFTLRAVYALALAIAFFSFALTASAVVPGNHTDPDAPWGERWVESRLIAPCCWTQTLDIHESEIATALRLEIHERIAKGEKPEAVEEDIVSRYGEKIRATPKGKDPMRGVAFAAVAAAIIGAIALGVAVGRWLRKPGAPKTPAAAQAPSDALDARIDEELKQLDG